MTHTTTRQLFIEAAYQTGAKVKIIHKLPLVMRLDFADGIRLFTHGNKPDVNRGHVKKIARDKDLTVRVLEEEAIPTPRSHFLWLKRSKFPLGCAVSDTPEYSKLQHFIERTGYPVFLKPNDGSQGKNVFCIRGEQELLTVIGSLLNRAQGFYIVQEACVGTEYRIAVVHGEIALAYTRKPLSVTGDGHATIAELFQAKKAELKKRGRAIPLSVDSEKIRLHLEAQGLQTATILAKGQEVGLLSNRNLSDGSEPVECTLEIKEKYADLCRLVHEKCGVEYCGLDLIEDTRDGTIKPVIIEINSNPGWKHFLRSAPQNADLVRSVFIKTIEALHTREQIIRAATRPRKSGGTTQDTAQPRQFKTVEHT